MQAVDAARNLPRLINDVAKIAPGPFGAVAGHQHGIDEALIDQVIFERSLVFEI